MKPRTLELLSPAATGEIGRQAILHGADAVYIGATSHGARKAAANSVEDIEILSDFAHQYRAKVYVTVNTIVFDNEIKQVENLCRDLYHAGVDALIVQDMGILRMKIPPIALHASTQCDIRTPEKAKFLQDVGFSQLVLARELTLNEIKAIAETVTIPVETFVHGALCVSYSGRCHASQALQNRSANRGECAQICRWPYTLTDSRGNVIAKDKYLLSLKDFNTSNNLKDLIEAGVSSFKIEGRLKEAGYVKNITSLYNLKLNEIIKNNPEVYIRSSFGEVQATFEPKAEKSFNRGFTNYFLTERKPAQIASLLTPKSLGEPIEKMSELNNGDGISFFNKEGQWQGVNVNRIRDNKIIPARDIRIPKDTGIYRTSDVKWDKLMNGETATRKIAVDIFLHDNHVLVKDERGNEAALLIDLEREPAKQTQDYRKIFYKLGNTIYNLRKFKSKISGNPFFRNSELTALRRKLIELLDLTNRATYRFEYRRKECLNALFPYLKLDYRDNVANKMAEVFYKSHGVKEIEKAAEAGRKLQKGDTVMTTRHCVLRELGLCKKEKKDNNISYPLSLNYKGGIFRLEFDCNRCEMQVKL